MLRTNYRKSVKSVTRKTEISQVNDPSGRHDEFDAVTDWKILTENIWKQGQRWHLPSPRGRAV